MLILRTHSSPPDVCLFLCGEEQLQYKEKEYSTYKLDATISRLQGPSF